jgi:hypothetical protein
MNLKHLISEKEILVNFNVAKKISSAKMKVMEEKVKKKMKRGDDLETLLKQEITKQAQKTLNFNEIPGLIRMNKPQTDKSSPIGIFKNETKVMMLNLFGVSLAKKMISQKFKKDEICFIILTVLGSLGLIDEDFRNFHKNNRYENDSLPEDDDDFEDDGYDEQY